MRRRTGLALAGRLLAATAVLVAGVLAGTARAQPPVWIVKGDHATMILFGSLHVLPRGLDWMPPVLSNALATSDEVWFELPMDAATQARIGALARERGLFKSGETLFGALDPAQRDRLTRDAAKVGVEPRALQTLRPWLADVVLSLALDGKSGADGADGVEARIEALAPLAARRRAFETPEQQIALLADASTAEQVAGLESTFDDIERKDSVYRRLLTAWMTGDVARLKHEVLDPLRRKTPDLYARLIADRNRRWVAAIDDRLAQGGTVVVVVGLGHLIGPDGVPARLRAQGVRVEGP